MGADPGPPGQRGRPATRPEVVGTTLIAFFLAEMGDKTQIATVALASHSPALAAVVLGTTLGMLLANVPAVYFGEWAARLLPLPLVRTATALMFVGLGLATLLRAAADLGLSSPAGSSPNLRRRVEHL